MLVTRARIVPSPDSDWYTKCIPSAVPPKPVPAPLTVKTLLESVALPASPKVPGCAISRSSHGLGRGCAVTSRSTELLASILGAAATPSKPEVAPDGIVIVIDVALHE